MEKYQLPRYYDLDPISSQEWQSLEHTQCSDMKDMFLYVSLLMVLLGSFWSPFFAYISYKSTCCGINLSVFIETIGALFLGHAVLQTRSMLGVSPSLTCIGAATGPVKLTVDWRDELESELTTCRRSPSPRALTAPLHGVRGSIGANHPGEVLLDFRVCRSVLL